MYRQKFGQSSSEDLCSDEESAYNFLTPEHRNGRDFHSPATVRYEYHCLLIRHHNNFTVKNSCIMLNKMLTCALP